MMRWLIAIMVLLPACGMTERERADQGAVDAAQDAAIATVQVDVLDTRAGVTDVDARLMGHLADDPALSDAERTAFIAERDAALAKGASLRQEAGAARAAADDANRKREEAELRAADAEAAAPWWRTALEVAGTILAALLGVSAVRGAARGRSLLSALVSIGATWLSRTPPELRDDLKDKILSKINEANGVEGMVRKALGKG